MPDLDPASTLTYVCHDGTEVQMMLCELQWMAATVQAVLKVLGGKVIEVRKCKWRLSPATNRPALPVNDKRREG